MPINIKIYNPFGEYVFIKRTTPKFVIFDEYDKTGKICKENTKRKVMEHTEKKQLFFNNHKNKIFIYQIPEISDEELWNAEKKDFDTICKNYSYKFLKDNFELLENIERTPNNKRVFKYKCKCGCVRRISHGWNFNILVKHTKTIKHKKILNI